MAVWSTPGPVTDVNAFDGTIYFNWSDELWTEGDSGAIDYDCPGVLEYSNIESGGSYLQGCSVAWTEAGEEPPEEPLPGLPEGFDSEVGAWFFGFGFTAYLAFWALGKTISLIFKAIGRT